MGMNEQEALDESTMATLDEAKLELVKHGFKPVNRADMLMVEGYQDEPNEFVATVFRDGDVQTSQVMKWLGY